MSSVGTGKTATTASSSASTVSTPQSLKSVDAAALSLQPTTVHPSNDVNKSSKLSLNGSHSKIIRDEYDTLIAEHPCKYYTVWIAFFLMGTFNNLGYVVILAAAKSLADAFNQSSLIGVVSWALIGVGFIFRAWNAFYLEYLSHRFRAFMCCFGFVLSYTMLTFSVYINFWFAIFSILIVGASCSIGESVMLGYLKLFPPKLTGAWSSGTGMAGIGGSGLYLLLDVILPYGDKKKDQAIFALMIPSAILYLLAIEVTWRSPLRKHVLYGKNVVQAMVVAANTNRSDAVPDADGVTQALIINDDENVERGDFDRASIGTLEEPLKSRLKRIWKQTGVRISLLMFVYLFEYVISVGLAQIANTQRNHGRQNRDFAILATCYQFGVFISRSSISVIELKKTPQLFTMTAIQGINCVIWHLHCQFHWFGEYVQFVWMAFVGLLGGAMYVNVAYSILSDEDIWEADKELSMNILGIFINIGITLSSVYEIFMDNTFFHRLVQLSSDD